LANIKSAIKRARQNPKHRKHNASRRSMLRTYIKTVVRAIENKNLEEAREALKKAQPVIDKAAGKGLIHKNKAARHMSRLNADVKAMSLATTA
jgi:small subunit ribosomal protein S20